MERRLRNFTFFLLHHGNDTGSDCVRVLVGCKADLEEEREVAASQYSIVYIIYIKVAASQGQKAAEEMESRYSSQIWAALIKLLLAFFMFRWTETSALTGSNVDLLFLELTQEMLARRQVYGPSKGVQGQGGPTPRGPGEGREVVCLQQRVETSFRLPKGQLSLRSKVQRIRKKPDCCS